MPASRGRARFLVAVEPTVLGDALAGMLLRAGDEVVLVLPGAAPAGGHFDVAVVTAGLAVDVDADLVIELPDHEGGRGTGRVTRGAATHEVEIGGLDDLLGLLP